jgi:type II secretory pathway component PulJ
MRRVAAQDGYTVVEMITALAVGLVVFAAVLTMLDVFLNQNRIDTLRNQAQDAARTTIDRITRALRNVAAPTVGSAGALEVAGDYQIVFQTVTGTPPPNGSLNTISQMRVRFCLNNSNSTNETIYQQTQTWTTATAPAIPSTSACPSAAWPATYTLAGNITNEIDNQNRPIFIYYPLSETSTQQINGVETDLFVDPSPRKQPGETEIKSAVYLRNSLVPPVASFTLTNVHHGTDVQLNASPAYDPNGQALSYQWYRNGSCPSPTGAVTGATTQFYDAGIQPAGNQTWTLVVTDTGHLANCSSQAVTIP